jgi:hypothetical protein
LGLNGVLFIEGLTIGRGEYTRHTHGLEKYEEEEKSEPAA